MKYSNGFDLDIVLPALRSRVGWRSESLVRSYESFHTLCTEQNLRDTQPTENISDEAFTTLKATIKDEVIQRCLSGVFPHPEYIQQALLHKRFPGTARQEITPADRFVGLRIRVAQDDSIAHFIKTVHLLFNEDVTFNLYLYADGNPEVMETIEVTAAANVPTLLNIDDLLLSYYLDRNSVYYLGYKESELGTAKAIRETVSWNTTNCFGATSFTMPEDQIDRFNPTYGHDTYGLNLEIHSFRDYTGLIEKSAHLFDEVLGLSMVYYVLEQITTTTRSNNKERILKGLETISLQHYLYGSVPAMGTPKAEGLNDLLAVKFQKIREAFFPKPKAITVSVC